MRYGVWKNDRLIAQFEYEYEARGYAQTVNGRVIDSEETQKEAERLKEHKQ